jgi:hypothetical protein
MPDNSHLHRPNLLAFEILRLMVQILVSNGTPQEVIPRHIRRSKGDTKGISEPTLRKIFRQELES